MNFGAWFFQLQFSYFKTRLRASNLKRLTSFIKMDQQTFSTKPADLKGPWDVAIIGSGPAALTAAIYTTRGAASTLILGGEIWGGQLMLTTEVDNFPGFPQGILGPKLMGEMRAQAERFGAEFVGQNVTAINISQQPFQITVNSQQYSARSIIIATGAETLWLDAPGVQKLIGRGVSSCAPCDAPFFKNKKVAVVGGGDSAMEEALVLTKYASEVTIIHRRDSFRASAAMQREVLENPKIKVVWNTEVTEVKGELKIESLELKNNKTGETSNFPVDGLFIAIGHKPGSEVFKGIIETDERGFIKKTTSDKRQETGYESATNVQGIFVAGDVHDARYKQAITAAGFGCMAGMDALKYLEISR
ncbi:MAG: Thioredoxin reductase [Candidatus Woesebacteria bacterium GW2011_GWB1_39_10]|uniref:Thioredoxin reductase n=2 Tax=Candidatus Woeseibacteriota TaxID=1752722 RepID=A0A0G0UU65_9BACT|nr:MAG: Thioredoxin reductase [Candidatus Woesebacteria bacterium GW2011_GWB1_39_10]KKR92299.1 MAG: Thioredoxin reductase [Candidatus Woesebacteria bacterium GW2011_GWA1_41_13b]